MYIWFVIIPCKYYLQWFPIHYFILLWSCLFGAGGVCILRNICVCTRSLKRVTDKVPSICMCGRYDFTGSRSLTLSRPYFFQELISVCTRSLERVTDKVSSACVWAFKIYGKPFKTVFFPVTYLYVPEVSKVLPIRCQVFVCVGVWILHEAVLEPFQDHIFSRNICLCTRSLERVTYKVPRICVWTFGFYGKPFKTFFFPRISVCVYQDSWKSY